MMCGICRISFYSIGMHELEKCKRLNNITYFIMTNQSEMLFEFNDTYDPRESRIPVQRKPVLKREKKKRTLKLNNVPRKRHKTIESYLPELIQESSLKKSGETLVNLLRELTH